MVFEKMYNSTYYSFFQPTFGSFIQSYPLTYLFIVSFVITLITTIAYKYLTNQVLMKSLKEEGKSLQAEMKQHKDNPTKLMELQQKSLVKTGQYFKHSMKSSLITIIPIIFIFQWLGKAYKGIDLNFLGLINSWFWVYLILIFALSPILRKLLKVH